MKTDVNLVNQFKNSLQKESGAVLTNEQAKAGLETLAKFFELLWTYDMADRRKEKAMNL